LVFGGDTGLSALRFIGLIMIRDVCSQWLCSWLDTNGTNDL
jgi:hypothetical protein